MQTFDCVVKYNAGAYVTNTGRGKRASCTNSARMAAEMLGKKLFGVEFMHVEELPTGQVAISLWRIFASTEA